MRKFCACSLETAEVGGEFVESPLAVVPVGRVADVVGEAGHVDQVGVAAQRDGHPAADLGNFQRMGQPGAGFSLSRGPTT